MTNHQNTFTRWLHDVRNEDVSEVGGKNASLGEMIKHLEPLGITIPGGFATTSSAYRAFIKENELENSIRDYLNNYHDKKITVEEASDKIRNLIQQGTIPTPIAQQLREYYKKLSEKYETQNVDVAVRSSATAEDLPSASFAGLQETYLNVQGEEALLDACKKCFGSLFTARAIVYREEKGFDHFKIALSVGIQKMIRADKSCSGVIFTIDTETGFPDVIVINGAWGLGENVVRGVVNPDQFMVFKPLLNRDGIVPILEKRLGNKEQKMIYNSGDGTSTKNIPTTLDEQSHFVLDDSEIIQLAEWAKIIEDHYQRPMDIEWVKDDRTHELYIVQARPETIHSVLEENDGFKNYSLYDNNAPVLLTGLSIGSSIVSGIVKKVESVDDLASITSDHILVTKMTEPDWVPSMKQAAGIITDSGGRTCHAAIVSRELGIPAVVGTQSATSLLKDNQEITLSCAEGDEGKIYQGRLNFNVEEIDLRNLPNVKTDIMLNVAVPESAFKWWPLPVQGIGLARMEFIISYHIKAHPMALIHFDKVTSESDKNKIEELTHNFSDKTEYFVEQLSQGIAKIAASQYPKPVILRTSDFKTNEYAGLIGGNAFEPHEENPMLGWRGACRYYSDDYREGFALECNAIKKARETIGLDNIIVMIPFCRTVQEAQKVLDVMESNGLKRGKNELEVYMMCEIPSNVILGQQFAKYFDGFSIGSNDLTQLVLGVDRDSAALSYLFDEDDEAVKQAIRDVIQKAHKEGIKVGFCGQAPSDNPDYAAFLVEAGIDSISLNPDSVTKVINTISQIEKQQKLTKV